MIEDVVGPLQELPREKLIESVYQTLLLLDRRKLVSEESDVSTMLDSLSSASGTPITPTLKAQVEGTIGRIVEQEKKPLQQIDDGRIASYRRALNALVQSSSAEFIAQAKPDLSEDSIEFSPVRQSERNRKRTSGEIVSKENLPVAAASAAS